MLNILHKEYEASTGWCVQMMQRSSFSLWWRTSLCQKLPSDSKKRPDFQKHIIDLWKASNYQLSQTGNTDKTPVYFDIPSVTQVHNLSS